MYIPLFECLEYLYQSMLDMAQSSLLCLFTWLGWLAPHKSCGLRSWNLTLCLVLALYVPTTFLCESYWLLFILGYCKHNLDSLTHNGASFFCYLGPPGIANRLVIILLSLGTSSFVSSEGTISNQLSCLSWLCGHFFNAFIALLWMLLFSLCNSCLLPQDYLACLLDNYPDACL